MGVERDHEGIGEERRQSEERLGRWYAEYVGCAYRGAVEIGMARVARRVPVVLKTDLWNECIGGARDVLGHLQARGEGRFFGVDLSRVVCVRGRANVPRAQVVQADISALPFRAESFDAVLDLSTLDHLSDADAAKAIGEYRRVLRGSGVLLLMFWQRSRLIRLRLFLKRLLGRREKPGQRYLNRDEVLATVGARLAILDEFVTGSLLILPHSLTGLLLAGFPFRALQRFLRWQVHLERSRRARPLLQHVAGLYGIVAIRREETAPEMRR
ncbi:MAG: class I SAM-dependent methyltransferase [Thermoanaerobaculales bacterium]